MGTDFTEIKQCMTDVSDVIEEAETLDTDLEARENAGSIRISLVSNLECLRDACNSLLTEIE